LFIGGKIVEGVVLLGTEGGLFLGCHRRPVRGLTVSSGSAVVSRLIRQTKASHLCCVTLVVEPSHPILVDSIEAIGAS
jgi:hypothetical protein